MAYTINQLETTKKYITDFFQPKFKNWGSCGHQFINKLNFILMDLSFFQPESFEFRTNNSSQTRDLACWLEENEVTFPDDFIIKLDRETSSSYRLLNDELQAIYLPSASDLKEKNTPTFQQNTKYPDKPVSTMTFEYNPRAKSKQDTDTHQEKKNNIRTPVRTYTSENTVNTVKISNRVNSDWGYDNHKKETGLFLMDEDLFMELTSTNKYR